MSGLEAQFPDRTYPIAKNNHSPPISAQHPVYIYIYLALWCFLFCWLRWTSIPTVHISPSSTDQTSSTPRFLSRRLRQPPPQHLQQPLQQPLQQLPHQLPPQPSHLGSASHPECREQTLRATASRGNRFRKVLAWDSIN